MSSRPQRQSLKLTKVVGQQNKRVTLSEKYEENSPIQVEFIDDEDVDIVVVGINRSSGTFDVCHVARSEQLADFLSKDLIKSTKKPKSNLLESLHQNNHSPKPSGKRVKPKKYIEETYEEEDNCYFDNETCEKPTGLYDEDDVAGENMCSFRTPKKKQGMLHKARESASKNITDSMSPKYKTTPKQNTTTPTTLKIYKITPKGKSKSVSKVASLKKTSNTTPKNISKETTNAVVPKTPYQLRVRHKKAIQDYRRKEVDSDSDYHSSSDSSSESENDESAKEEDSSGSSSDSGKGSKESKPICRRSLRFQRPFTTSIKKRGKDLNYIVESEEYFQSRSNKSVTSDRNLSRLKTPRLDSSALQGLLTQYSVSTTHQQVLAHRREEDFAMFHRWKFALSQGFSILAYGLGSKYKILQNFHCKMLQDSHVLVINGFFPSLTIKEIVEMIAKDLLGFSQAFPSPHSIIDWIENRRWMPRVFIIVHNLDAPMLRCEKTQNILSRLASMPKIHLIASIDHINCPLLWDQCKLSNFNFMWEDITSFLPYQEETSYETSLMVQNSGSLALSSLLNVYRSLTHNSRGVFRIILDEHLNENSKKYTGMAFSALYSRCREEMLVTSDLALRTMLTEFIDHQMVKWRQNGENLYIPTDIGILQQFKQLILDS